MADRIQLRRDTAANWTAYNPILLEGEPGIELDTDQWKLGDGIHTWSQLAYRGGEYVQQTGQSTTVAMSQKAVTDELDKIETVLTGSALILEQGGLWSDGSESSDPNYVRNHGFINPPFSVSVNSGYKVIQVNLYNADDTVNQLLTDLGSSYSYNGNLRARVVFCKNPLAVINPDEYGLIVNTYQSASGGLVGDVNNLKDKDNELENKINQKANLPFVLEQGGLWGDGSESVTDYYVRTIGKIPSPFSIEVNSGYQIVQVVEYDSSGGFVSSTVVSTTEYEYNGIYKVRLVINKTNGETISPYENIIASYTVHNEALTKIVADEESVKNNLGVLLEQGGIYTNGGETVSPNYVRTAGFLDSPFKIELASGYQIVQIVLYDKDGVAISKDIQPASGTSSYEYAGGFKSRIVFSKNPNDNTIRPNQKIIKSIEFSDELRLDAVEDAVFKKNDLQFESGGFNSDGGEMPNDNFVRSNFIYPPFSLAVNSGYQIYHYCLYDNDDNFVSDSLPHTDFLEYTGEYKMRVAICKIPQTVITPEEDFVKFFYSNSKIINDDLSKRVKSIENDIYGENELTFEQGGLWGDGSESTDNRYVRNHGFINPPFSVSVNSGFTIIQVNLYNADGTVNQMLTDLGTSYSYNGELRARVVFCKTPLAVINPNEYDDIIDTCQITSNGITQQIKSIEDDLYGENELTFEQGGLWGDGSESSDTNYVRNKGYIDQSFNISVKSGYIINQYNLYDENGICVSMGMLGETSFSYNGEYKVRLVFCKTPLATIDPNEKFIYEFKADGLLDRVTNLENETKGNILVAHSLQSIGVDSPKNYNFCFFDKFMRISYNAGDEKLNKTGLWSDGKVWRNIVDNNLFITGRGFKTIKITDGSTIASLNKDRVDNIHSVTKLMNMVIVCDSGIDLNTKVIINAEDKSTSYWYNGYVDVGDEVTIYDLMCATVIISDNCAANTLGRVVGYLLNPNASSDAEARQAFINAMNAKAQSLGMTNTSYGSTFGSIATSTPTDQCLLAKEIYTNAAYAQIRNKWGLVTYQMTITGTNARTYTITNEINSSIREIYIPGFIGGKPGQGGYSTLLYVWEDEDDIVYASYVAESVLYNGNCVYPDARRVIDYSLEQIE